MSMSWSSIPCNIMQRPLSHLPCGLRWKRFAPTISSAAKGNSFPLEPSAIRKDSLLWSGTLGYCIKVRTHMKSKTKQYLIQHFFLWLSCQKESPSSTTDLMIGILGSCSLGTNMNMEVDKVSATVENQYREISLSKVVRFLFPKTWWVKMYLHWM